LRYFLECSYNGKAYHGWQNQPNAITVQQVMEDALSTLLRTPIAIMGAGRTDAGVHAKQLFAHFDVAQLVDAQALVRRLNSLLPEDIAVQTIFKVQDNAHARFDATQRTYEYWVVQKKNPFYGDAAHYVWSALDIRAMNKAADILKGYTDFECFSKSNTDVKTFICHISQAVWQEQKDKLVFTISADRFLRNMVRAIVGTFLDVGLRKVPPEKMHEIIASKDRGQAGASVPAKGLYLTQVIYPETIGNG